MVAKELQKNEDSNRKGQKFCKRTQIQGTESRKHPAQHRDVATVRLLGEKYTV